MSRLYSDLQSQAFACTQLDRAVYPTIWTKWIDSVDMEKKSGFCFGGEFFSDGPQEIETTKPRLILLAASTGIDGYQRGRRDRYHLIYEEHHVLMFANGQIEPTGLSTSDPRAWAMQLRDQVNLWIHRINATFGEATELQQAWDHLTMRLVWLRQGEPYPAWTADDGHAVTVLMTALEAKEKGKGPT